MRNIILIIVVVAVAAYIFMVIKKNREASTPQYVEQAVTLNQPEPEQPRQPPPVKYPVTEAEPEPAPVQEPVPVPEPLPALDKSDDSILAGLAALSGEMHWGDLFLPKSIVRHFVVTVDNMTATKLPQKYRLTPALQGKFQVRMTGDETIIIDPENYARYETYVRLAEIIDLKQLTALYKRWYPLFQQAYEELGYPGRYFNDRLVAVVEHLLEAPEVRGAIELKQPKVFYIFADPKLEALSAGQKLLVRIGPDNAARIKIRLRELRTLLAGNN